MSPLSRAVKNLASNPHISVEFSYQPQGGGTAHKGSGFLTQEDDMDRFNLGQFISDAVFLQVLSDDIASPRAGDKIEIGPDKYEIRSDPMRDADSLIWRLPLVKK